MQTGMSLKIGSSENTEDGTANSNICRCMHGRIYDGVRGEAGGGVEKSKEAVISYQAGS